MKLVKSIAAVLCVWAPSLMAQAPNPGSVYVQGITYNGTGCPNGSVATSVSDDLTAFTLLFNQYIAQAGAGVPLTEMRKNCQAVINLHIPQGWQFSIATVDTRGFLALDPLTRAVQTSKYYFQGSAITPTKSSSWAGPVVRDYSVRDVFGIESTVWSDCHASRNLNISTAIYVTAPAGRSALATIDSIDGAFVLEYGLQWRRCS